MPETDELSRMLRAARHDHFDAGFATRVVRRTTQLQQHASGATLQRYFTWLVPAAITLIAVLAVHNAHTGEGRTLDALLSLPTVSLDVSYMANSTGTIP